MNLTLLLRDATEVWADDNFIAISYDIDRKLIYTGNLPQEVKDLIAQAKTIRKCHNTELLGMDGRKVLWAASYEHWTEEDMKEHAQYLPEDRRHPHILITAMGAGKDGLQWTDYKV